MKYCPNCGKETRINAKFCSACGYVLANYQAPGAKSASCQAVNETVTASQAPAKEARVVNPFEEIGTKEPRYSDFTDLNKQDYSETRSAFSHTTRDADSCSSPDMDGYAASETNGYAIASLICGILAFPLNALLFIPGILAIIFGIVGMNRSKETGKGYALSMTGLILGIITSAGYVILLISAVMLAIRL